ncbi:MAG: hypothetical protein KJZ98_14500 [Burkholderiaceae bacterium]|nr:hypothetical protein [Burkholderiaceae bacterium]MEB2351818.1 hypothetical protein [Burkholderiaceae bacterium]
MSRNGFIALLLLTVAAIGVGAWIAEHFAGPGLARTLIVAAFAALVVFPAAKFAGHRGWINGELDFSKLGGRSGGATQERGDAK